MLEANGALRSVARCDTGESYEAFLMRLAKASGIATPTREDLARLKFRADTQASPARRRRSRHELEPRDNRCAAIGCEIPLSKYWTRIAPGNAALIDW
jgi:hypothetical protein